MTEIDTPKEQPTTNTGNGGQSQATSVLDEATKIKEGLDRTLAEIREERTRLEELRARQIFGGRAEGGQPTKSPNELAKEEHLKRWEGSGMNPFKGEGAKALE